MPETRVCSFTSEEIEPGTGLMYIKRDGSVMWFKDSKAEERAPAQREQEGSSGLKDT